MVKYIVKRMFYIIPTFFVLTFLVFVLLSATPGDSVAGMLGPTATQEEIDAKKSELGLDKPVLIQYANYMKGMAHGDIGESWITKSNVLSELIVRIPNTLKLTTYAIILTVMVGIPMGVVAAVRQYSVIDKFTLVVALFFISIPNFFLSLILQLVFALKLNILPAAGATSYKYYILPTIVLAASQIGTQVRMTRSSMLDVLQQDYVRTAKAKGIPQIRIITYHVLRNGLLPVVTGVGNSITTVVSNAAIAEMIFAIPGIGSMLVNAVRTKDVPMVMGTMIFVSLFVCLINVIVDIVYAFIDPRVRLRYYNK